MLVGERRNGNLLVQLAPKLQAQPKELLRQRWSVDGHVEYLIRWAVHSTEESGSGIRGATSQAENKSSNILMWMSAEEVYSNCPTLLGKRKPEGPGVPEEKSPGAPDEGALQEMSEDVRMLVQRAARQMSHSGGPDSSILNTIHVLSAYASIGSLTGVFKETGALDLLMKMLCNPEKQIRKNAGKMLRALASHDAGSRAHVLLSLSQQDGIEQHMDFESRFTLLQLFAETTSSEEHCISFDGIHLPQIPGKQLFSLVKRYLCVTSLLDQLSSDRPDREDTDRLQRQFDFCMAMGSLICELVRVMGHRMEGPPSVSWRGFGVQRQSHTPKTHVSGTCEDMAHTCHTLQQGMEVRVIQDTREMPVGDEGTLWQRGREMPPVQLDMHHVLKRGEKNMGVTNKAVENPVDTLSSTGCISHGDWWELLFFIRQLNCEDQDRVLEAVRPGVKKPDLLALLQMTVTTGTVREIVRLLCDYSPSWLLSDLQNSHLYTRFCTTAASPKCGRAGAHPGVMEVRSSPSFPAGSQTPAEDGKADLQVMDTPLLLEGLHLSSDEESVAEIGPVLPLQDMDVASLLHSLKDVRLCRELLPSLERCVCGDASSLPCDVSQLLTDTDFFLQLLSSIEQLRSEKQLQLCVYRILQGLLLLSREELFPWHQSIRPSVCALTTHCSEKELVQEVTHFLHSLASLNKDCATLMCCLNAGEALKMVMERHGSNFQVAADLRTLLKSYEEPARVSKMISSSVLTSCLQMILEQIDDQRCRHQQIRVPFFAVFLRSLGHESWAGQKEDKCWGKMEVSSNPHRANKLADGNPKSYWESSGSTGSHYINIFMHRGVVIRQLLMVVASEDSSYMPARVLVMGGENATNISTELNAVNISSSTSRVVLLENATRFWPVVQVKIKRCQQGGIDTRVRGLEVLGPKPMFWPVFKEQLCRRTFLFYTSRAHSWGQEICEKKERLLQLFSRLNRALSHEQEFADRFLPDNEAAQALGRTCWEALISPLVRSITTSDSGAVSPLSWLLNRYLENIQGARRPKAQTSIFNSRVRRLTHLLVHVDTSPQDTAGLKPPNGKSRDTLSPPVRPSGSGWSSMAGIAQCWQEVVRKQVQHFLEMYWNNVDLAPRICSMYRALRLAMDEMFGQQMRFLLSLRHGFCEGLLQLSFLTALHVTEQFARYIDQLVTAIRADSSDLRALELLQEFLDFILFLSDLELANSFEHFYRHYLADRLLSLGPCWLENTVVDHIGICFPNRFPQQMLKNLQEGKDLLQEEHLYRLQEHDREVLSEENEEEEDDDQEEEMVVMESPVLQVESVEDAEVKISVLSPRCWPISPLCYLTDPLKYLPETLGTPLQRFTDFYTRSQAVPGSDLAPSRRLQWTWLGNAEVQYGDLTLRVSTLQMFILLLFNQHQEVSTEDIKQHTGTSGTFLVTSLDSLTCDTGILSHHEDTGCLRVNEEALRHSGESQTVLDFSIRQTERRDSKEMICALEKRRQLLSCVLERVMKDEREIQIDRLLFRVLDGFRREASVTPPGDCGVPDVLSCITRQLENGVIHRKANRPWILCHTLEAPFPAPLCPLTSHAETITPIPPQVSEFCRVRKFSSNIAPVPEQRPTFSTFKSIE
ncbi:cullin-7 isoform X2 [Dendrobates tinctorius]|uniref:cullin-7 isoform X2 n=1 Tax=Dendrobates tinctorius TaxID=92724 RepID=UPI003CC9B469